MKHIRLGLYVHILLGHSGKLQLLSTLLVGYSNYNNSKYLIPDGQC